jgi:hypothetical protein
VVAQLVLFVPHLAGAEHATINGAARSFDHNQLIHEIWWHALQHRIHLWVVRVPSKDNVADGPSRSEYGLMGELGAMWREPVLADFYLGDSM